MIDAPGTRKVWPRDYGDAAPARGDCGIKCPKCHCQRTNVTHTRPAPGGARWRRRTCGNCGHVFSTYER